MSLKRVLKGAKHVVSLPVLAFSFYLVVIYSNGFWREMIGSEHVAISACMLVTSLLSWFSSFPAFLSRKKGSRKRGYLLFSSGLWLSFMFAASLIYLTRDLKKQQCLFWMNSFISMNQNTFYIDSFTRSYSTSGEQEYFVHLRTLDVHDWTICVLVLSILLYFVIIVCYEEVRRRLPEQLLDTNFKMTPSIHESKEEFEEAERSDAGESTQSTHQSLTVKPEAEGNDAVLTVESGEESAAKIVEDATA